MKEEPISEEKRVDVPESRAGQPNLPEDCFIHICDLGWWRMKDGQLLPSESPNASGLREK